MIGDLALADYPLGVLRCNGGIDDDLWRAGSRYAWLYCASLGRAVHITAAAVDPLPAGKDDDTPAQSARRAGWSADFKAARAAFGTRRDRDLVENLCVHERIPRWMRPQVPRDSDVQEAQATIAALRLLAAHFGYGRRMAA